MIRTLLGQFFRSCIQRADDKKNGIRVDLYDPSYMTDQEISDFLHGRGHAINWDKVKLRRQMGFRQDPWPAETERQPV